MRLPVRPSGGYTEHVLFAKPPVVEVVLGVQFDRANASIVDLGGFATTLREQYPDVIDVHSIPRTIEPPEGGFGGPVRVELMNARVQMYAPGRQHFLQLQTDRLHANWQRTSDADTYPRFDGVWERFNAGWTKWKAYCGTSPPLPVQYEITYVNHVQAGDLWSLDKSISVVCPWLRAPAFGSMPEVEAAFHYWVPECRGRLHVITRTARKLPEMRPVLVLELTLRGANVKAGSDEDMKAWMDVAHEKIDASFKALTSPEAHQAWRLQGGAS